MQGILIEVDSVCDLDNAAEIHHRHARRDVLDYGQTVGDEKVSQAEFLLQVL